MKLHQGLMVIALTLTVMSGDLFAQDSDDRMFGSGRFLRRMKNEFAGKPDPKKKSSAKADAKSKGKSPTPATRSSNSPALGGPAKWSSNRPSQTYRPTPAKRPGSVYQVPQLDAPRVAGVSKTTKQTKAPDLNRSAKKPTFGFGMLLEMKREQLVVTQLDPKGNAADAGIKRGDVVVEAGGVEMNTMQEFNDVTDILEAGDQIEFVVLRKGKKDKKDKILIMHGKGPTQEVGETIEPAEPAAVRAPSTRKYQFVPDPAGKNMKHVSSMPSVMAPSRQAYQLNRPVAQQQRASTPRSVVEQQQLQIQKMQLEIERLRRTNGVQLNQESSNNTILSGPDLSGPGQ